MLMTELKNKLLKTERVARANTMIEVIIENMQRYLNLLVLTQSSLKREINT